MNKRHYNQIDALKGIAIFLVILGHSIIVYPINLHENNICDWIFRWVSSVHMPLFFIISGFCFSFRGEYKPFINKKIKRLVIPYIVFNLIDILPRCLLPSLVNRPRGIGESIRKILFEGGEYWFLYTLFVIFLIFPFISRFIRNNIFRAIGVLAVIILLHHLLPSISIFLVSKIVYYLSYFTIGFTIRNFIGNQIFEVKFDKLKTFTLVLIFLVIWFFLIDINVQYLSMLTALLGIGTFYICVQSESLVCLFERFGKYSLQLYLLNGYWLTISRTIVVPVLGATNPFVIIVFNMLVDFGLSYIVIKYVCDKIKVVRFFMGML